VNSSQRDFNKAAAHWDQGQGRKELANDVAQAIINAGIIREDMKVLDFGCGTGLLTLQLQPLVDSIIGLDNSEGMLQVMREKIELQQLTNIETKLLNLEAGDRLEGAYDLIVSSMTLHHIQDIKAIFHAFFQVIKPGGYLSIADLDLDKGLFHQDNTGVCHHGFDRAELQHILEEAGFNDIRFVTAAEMIRTNEAGTNSFSVFLVTGIKQ